MSVLGASRYGASAPPRHVSGLSNDSRDLVPRQTSYDDDSFDADSSGGMQASAAHRRRAPRGSKLSLGRRDVRGSRRSKNSNGSSAAASDPLSKALSAAKRIQVSELKNEIESLSLELEEIKKENKVLKRTVVIHEKSLGKYEDRDGGSVAQLVERHSQETHALRELMKRAKDENRKLSKLLHDAQEELETTRRQLKKLQTIADNDSLVERDNLSRKLKAATDDLDKKNERITELKKHIELLVKNHNRELNVETKRLREVKAELEELQRKYNKPQPHAKLREHGQAHADDASGAHTDRPHHDSSGAPAAAPAVVGGSRGTAAPPPLASSLPTEVRLNGSLTKTGTPRAAASSDEASDRREFFLTNQTDYAAHVRSGAGVDKKADSELHQSGQVSSQLPKYEEGSGRADEPWRQPQKKNVDQQSIHRSVFDHHPKGVDLGGGGELRQHNATDDATTAKKHFDSRGPSVHSSEAASADHGSVKGLALQPSSARGGPSHAYRSGPSAEQKSLLLSGSFDGADRSKQQRFVHEPDSTDVTWLSSPRDSLVNASQKRQSLKQPNVLPDFMHTADDAKFDDRVVSRVQKTNLVNERPLHSTIVDDDEQSARDRRYQLPADKIDAANDAAAAEERRKKDLLLQKMKEIDRSRGFDSSVRPDATLLLRPQVPIAAETRGNRGVPPASTDRPTDDDADKSASTARPGSPERRDRLLKLLRIDASHVEATEGDESLVSRPTNTSSASTSYQPSFQSSSGDRQPLPADARPPKRSNLISELFGADSEKEVTVKSAFDEDDLTGKGRAGRFSQAPAGRGAAARLDAQERSEPGVLPPSLGGGGRPREKYAAAAPPASFTRGLVGGVDTYDNDDIEVMQL